MRIGILLLAMSVLATAGSGVAPGGGPPSEFPGPGDFPGQAPPLPDPACERLPELPLGNVPGWVAVPGCSD